MQAALNLGYLARACQGESVCGDAGRYWDMPGRRVLALADGLGHGPAAQQAAEGAMRCISGVLARSAVEMLLACNERLLNTRGAVLAIAVIELASQTLTLVSIGNIRTRVLSGQGDVRLGSGRGIVGAGRLQVLPEQFQLTPGDTVVMFSDGVDDAAQVCACLDRQPLTPQQLAQEVVARWGRANDDASVLVYRHTLAQKALS